MSISMLNVKTGCMLDDSGMDFDIDHQAMEDDIFKLPRFRETGISGAAGFYILFDYDGLDECNEFLQSDVEAVKAITDKYKARANERKAHPHMVDACESCKDDYSGLEEFNGVWDVDQQEYCCENCEAVVT
jgi:hypothetical protein